VGGLAQCLAMAYERPCTRAHDLAWGLFARSTHLLVVNGDAEDPRSHLNVPVERSVLFEPLLFRLENKARDFL
jgi:hypothetical protein